MYLSFLQIYGFVLDFMHTVGGGAAIEAFEAVFGIDPKSKAAPKIGVRLMVLVNMYMEAWSDNTPKEMGRNVRGLDKRNMWKMREAHQALTYQSIPLMAIDEVREKVGEEKATAFIALAYAVHLIGGTRHDPPSEADFNAADDLFRHYVKVCVKNEGKEFLTYKNHCLVHLANEARFYNTHLGGVDAYPFENFLSVFRRQLVKSGKSVLEQCYNSLKKISYHALARNEQNEIEEYSIDSDTLAAAMVENGSMHLPATTIISKELDRANQLVQCLGFVVTTKYPDNVVILTKDIDENQCGAAKIFVVKSILESERDGSLRIEGHTFCRTMPAHDKFWKGTMKRILPKPLSTIGCYEARLGLEESPIRVPFSAVIGKCFPFHMNLRRNGDPLEHIREISTDQWWIMLQMMHTMQPQTL